MDGRQRAALRRRVQKGVSFLNEKRPGWFKKIAPSKLDLASCDLCVLGQLYAGGGVDGYTRGLEVLNGAVAKDPRKFGFDFTYGTDDYPILTAMWQEEIAAQRRIASEAKRGVNEIGSFLREEVTG